MRIENKLVSSRPADLFGGGISRLLDLSEISR